MLNIFKRKRTKEAKGKNINSEKTDLSIAKEAPVVILKTYDEASEEVQKWMMTPTKTGEVEIAIDEKQNTLSMAMSRNITCIEKAKTLIIMAIEEKTIMVEGYTSLELASKIFTNLWGLGVIEQYATDKETDEIRVNAHNKIYVVKEGVAKRLNVSFKDEEEVEIIIKRMITESIGVSIDHSNPIIELVLADGSRLTAVAPPITKTWTFILRRHGVFIPTLENYQNKSTLDKKTWEALTVLVKGRANILISGNVGAGKTTMMRKLTGEHNEKLRLAVIGKDSEVLLSEMYPKKDIIELEEKKHLGITMKELFVTLLRESPDLIIVEEFRGGGEAIEAIRACTRGLDGSMATAHFNTAYEAIEGTALFMLEEGLNLPIDVAKLRVARAFNIVIQMHGDAITGKKKIVGITEIHVDSNSSIHYIELMKWIPSTHDYYGEGQWIYENQPSLNLKAKILKNIPVSELEKVGWA